MRRFMITRGPFRIGMATFAYGMFFVNPFNGRLHIFAKRVR